MVTKSLNYKIGADLGDLRRKMEEQGDLTRKQRQELAKLEAQQRKNRAAMDSLGKGMLTFGAAAVLGLGMAVREAIRWESAFAGVRKTVDGSDEEIAALEGELRNLAKTLPATHQEIAAVAEAAGQLGIKRQDVAEFTKTMIDLGETTNLSAEEAATALAKFMNIMGTSASDVDRLGSALVALGNDGASTEADIIDMGLRIAGAGRQVGMTESQVLAFASALSSVGIEAEAGGSAFSRVMVDIAESVNEGGAKLKSFADVAGMSTATFSELFRQDAAGAIQAFVVGLGRMQASGQDVFGVLGDLEFSEIRVRDALLRAAGASGLFEDALRTGSDAWIENSALAEEAAKRYQTTESQMAIAGNAIKDALIDIGAAILPIVKGAIEGIRNLVTWFQNLPAPIQTAVAILGVATAAVTVLGGAALIAAPKILAFRESMSTMIATGGGFAGALGKFGKFMVGPWGAAIGLGITLLGAFGIASGAAQQRQQELAEAGKAVAQAIIEQNGIINQSVRITTAKQAAEQGLLGNAKRLGINLGTVTDAILDQGNAYEGLKSKIEGIIAVKEQQLHNARGEGNMDSAKVDALSEEIAQYKALMDGINGMRGQKEKTLLTEEAVAEATGQTVEELRAQTDATQDSAIAAEEAAQAFEDLLTQLDRLNGVTLSAREAQRSYLDSINAVGESIKENGTSLDINTAAGRANLETLDGQASAANDLAEAVGKEAEAQGGAAAGAAAFTASLEASRQALFNSARQFGLTEAQAWAYVDSVLAVPEVASTLMTTPGSIAALAELLRVKAAVEAVPPGKEINVGVLSAAAIQALRDIGIKVTTLPDGSVTVNAETAAARSALQALVDANKNRVLTWQVRIVNPAEPGRRGLGGQYTPAYGGILKFASGGIFGESHHPQIAQATPGAVRVWAEPETGNESYIPWARDRRGRATDILGITANAFGYMLVPKSRMVRSYAQGGVNGGGYSSSAMAGMLAGLEVCVYIGNEEFSGYIRTQVRDHDRQTKRAVNAGSGNNR